MNLAAAKYFQTPLKTMKNILFNLGLFHLFVLFYEKVFKNLKYFLTQLMLQTHEYSVGAETLLPNNLYS